MADERKISELTEVTTLSDDDELVLVHYGDVTSSLNFASLTSEYENLPPEQRNQEVSDSEQLTGTIVWVDLEGGFYGIEIPSVSGGDKYLPINIQDDLMGHEGTEVKITQAYSEKGAVGIYMWGKMIFVEQYEIIFNPDEPIDAQK